MKDHVRRYTVHTTHSSLTHPRRVDMMVCMCVEFDIEDLWGGTFSKLCRLATESFKRLEENWSTADTHPVLRGVRNSTPDRPSPSSTSKGPPDTHPVLRALGRKLAQRCVDVRSTESFEHFEGTWSTAGHPPIPSRTSMETRPTLCRRPMDRVLRALRRNLVDRRHPPSPSGTWKETRPTLCRRSIDGVLRALRRNLVDGRTPTLSFEHLEGNSPSVVSTFDRPSFLRALRRNLVDRRHPPSPSGTSKETRPTLCRRSIDGVLRALRRNLVDGRTPTHSFEDFDGNSPNVVSTPHGPSPSSTSKEPGRPPTPTQSFGDLEGNSPNVVSTFDRRSPSSTSKEPGRRPDTHPVLRALGRKLAQRCVDVRSTEFSSSTSKEPGRPPTPTQSFGDFEGNSPNVVSTFDRPSSFEHFEGTWSTAGHPPSPSSTSVDRRTTTQPFEHLEGNSPNVVSTFDRPSSFEHFEGTWSTPGQPPSPSSTSKETRPTLCRRSIDRVPSSTSKEPGRPPDTHPALRSLRRNLVDRRTPTQSFEHFEGNLPNVVSAPDRPSPSSTSKETRPTLCRRSIDGVLRALRRNLVDGRTPTLSFEHLEGNSPSVVSTFDRPSFLRALRRNLVDRRHPPSPSGTSKETRPTLCRRSIDGVLRALRRNLVDGRTPTLSFEHLEGNSPSVVSTFDRPSFLRALRRNLVDRRHPPSPSGTSKETRPTLCRRSIDLVPSSTSKEPGRPPDTHPALRALRSTAGQPPSPSSTWKETRPTLCRRSIDRVPSSTSKEPGRPPDNHPALRALRRKLAQRCVDVRSTEFLRALRRNLVDRRTPTQPFDHFEGTWSTAGHPPSPSSTSKETCPTLCRRRIDRVLRALRRKLAQRCVDVRSTESFEHFEGTWSTAGHPPCPSSTWKETRPALCRRSIDRVPSSTSKEPGRPPDTHPVLRALGRKLAQRCVDAPWTESFEHFEGTWSTNGHPVL